MILFFRWLKPIFSIGLKRPIEEDDVYGVLNGMRSERNTEIFAKGWESELKKDNPSIFSLMLKLYGFKVLAIGFLFSIGETMARWVDDQMFYFITRGRTVEESRRQWRTYNNKHKNKWFEKLNKINEQDPKWNLVFRSTTNLNREFINIIILKLLKPFVFRHMVSLVLNREFSLSLFRFIRFWLL